MHHAAVDGMGAHQFIFALHDLEPVFPEGEYGTDLAKRRVADKPGLPEMMARGYTNFLKQQLNLAKLGAKALPQMAKEREFRKKHGLAKTPKKPTTRFEKPVSPNRVYGALEFPMAKVKEIRKAIPNVTVNDLAITVVSRALRTYLSDKDELPEESLTSMVPVSLRKQEEAGDGGNAVSMLNVAIHTNIDDPLDALRQVNETMVKTKARREEVGESLTVQLADTIPSLVQSGLGQLMSVAPSIGCSAALANTTISNVPGPRVPMYLAGAKAIKFHGVGILMQGLGLFNVVSSYMDDMTISFLSCRNQMPDPATYEAAIGGAFDEIYDAAMASTKPKSTKKK